VSLLTFFLTAAAPHHCRVATSVFSLGYLVLLSCFPLLLVWSTSYKETSRKEYPRLIRAVSIYSGLVTCIVYLFLDSEVNHIPIQRHIGDQLDKYGKSCSPAVTGRVSNPRTPGIGLQG
jgi:hypothetical protein